MTALGRLFEKLRKAYDKDGWGSPAYNKVQKSITEELMTIRFTAKTIEKLCDMVRAQVDDVRKKSVSCAKSLWINAACHRKHLQSKNSHPTC